MSCLGFEEAAVEPAESWIVEMIPQQNESFAAAGFDQRRDQQTIHSASGFFPTHQCFETPPVGSGFQSTEANPHFVKQVPDHLKMFQFLPDNGHHFDAEFFILNVVEHQVHCCRRRLLFTVRVIDQDFIQMLLNLNDPAFW